MATRQEEVVDAWSSIVNAPRNSYGRVIPDKSGRPISVIPDSSVSEPFRRVLTLTLLGIPIMGLIFSQLMLFSQFGEGVNIIIGVSIGAVLFGIALTGFIVGDKVDERRKSQSLAVEQEAYDRRQAAG